MYRNHKPSDSDIEDDDEDSDGEDPADWFEDDQDDGRKGQNLVDPDELTAEDFDHIIKVDADRWESMIAERDALRD